MQEQRSTFPVDNTKGVSSSHSQTLVGDKGTNVAMKFVQLWEENAKLEENQHDRIAKISHFLSQTSATEVPDHVAQATDTGLGEQGIENMQQFYNWFASMAEEGRKEEEEKYCQQVARVAGYQNSTKDLLAEIMAALRFLDDLESEYKVVSTKTGELHRACEALVQEKSQLVAFADNLRGKLSYFDELDRITSRFNSASLSVLDEQFVPLLQRLDDCIAFIKSNPNYYQAEVHLLKFQQLQNRGLTITKNYIVNSLKQTTLGIISSMKQGEKMDGSLVTAKFRAVAPRLRSLCVELEKRSSYAEYNALLKDCHNCYFQQRRQLLMSTAQATVQGLASASDLPSMIRSSCSYILQLCQQEYQLYHRFFGTHSSALRALLEDFSTLLYEAVRPLVIHCHNIETLCGMTQILKTEIMHDQITPRGESVAAFQPVVVRLIEDVQERLCFLVQTYIRDEIASYIAKPQDLDYPKKLLSLNDSHENSNIDVSIKEQDGTMYSTWYPTLSASILCLGKLYLAVDTKIFEGLAQEMVSVCCSSLLPASRTISKLQGPVHGQLFLIRHLLLLREQITPFDINFSIVEKTLDFSHTKDAISRLLSGSGSVFTLAPRVRQEELNSKKELEQQLLTTMQSFIMSVIRTLMEPMLSFLTQTTAIMNVLASRKEDAASPPPHLPTSEKVQEIVLQVKTAVEEQLPQILQSVQLYLKHTGTKINRLNIINTLRENMVQYVHQFYDVVAKAGSYEGCKESLTQNDPREAITHVFSQLLQQ